MLITQKSSFTGVVHSIEMDVTQRQLDAWKAGELIQNAMPHLTPAEREFVMTGITESEWDNMFGGDE